MAGTRGTRAKPPSDCSICLKPIRTADFLRVAKNDDRHVECEYPKGPNGPSLSSVGDRLFIGIFPGGISYADRFREEHGDYKKLAFLPYDTLRIKWYETSRPALVAEIIKHAASILERRGQDFEVSACGQTVRLGS
jgi:hypothetical protein